MNIYEQENEFEYIPSIFNGKMDLIKHIMKTELTDSDRRILIIYLNAGSFRKAQKICNIDFRQINIIVRRSLFIIKHKLIKIEHKNKLALSNINKYDKTNYTN